MQGAQGQAPAALLMNPLRPGLSTNVTAVCFFFYALIRERPRGLRNSYSYPCCPRAPAFEPRCFASDDGAFRFTFYFLCASGGVVGVVLILPRGPSRLSRSIADWILISFFSF
jgi:hypothetical protein